MWFSSGSGRPEQGAQGHVVINELPGNRRGDAQAERRLAQQYAGFGRYGTADMGMGIHFFKGKLHVFCIVTIVKVVAKVVHGKETGKADFPVDFLVLHEVRHQPGKLQYFGVGSMEEEYRKQEVYTCFFHTANIACAAGKCKSGMIICPISQLAPTNCRLGC